MALLLINVINLFIIILTNNLNNFANLPLITRNTLSVIKTLAFIVVLLIIIIVVAVIIIIVLIRIIVAVAVAVAAVVVAVLFFRSLLLIRAVIL